MQNGSMPMNIKPSEHTPRLTCVICLSVLFYMCFCNSNGTRNFNYRRENDVPDKENVIL